MDLGSPQSAIVLASFSCSCLCAFTAGLLAVVVLAQGLEVPLPVVIPSDDVIHLGCKVPTGLAGVDADVTAHVLVTVEYPATDALPVGRESPATGRTFPSRHLYLLRLRLTPEPSVGLRVDLVPRGLGDPTLLPLLGGSALRVSGSGLRVERVLALRGEPELTPLQLLPLCCSHLHHP